MSAAEALCEACERPAGLRYSACQDSRYCSKECQKTGWQTHKLLCKTFKDFETRPDTGNMLEKYARAIYFNPEESAPRFVWLKTERVVCVFEADAWSVDSHNSFAHDYALVRQLPHTIFMVYRENFLNDGSPRDKNINKVIDTRSRYLHDWRGPIIFHGTNLLSGLISDPVYIEDLTPADLSPIIHWLNIHHVLDKRPEYVKEKFAKVIGVRMNCLGDEIVNGRPKCEPISVEYWTGQPSVDGGLPYVNQPATYLHIGCDPNITDGLMDNKHVWGFAPGKWQNEVGTVALMRADKKPLLPKHAKALTEFCRFHINKLVHEQQERESDAENVLQEITKDNFLQYYATWKAGQTDEKKRNQVSPYEV